MSQYRVTLADPEKREPYVDDIGNTRSAVRHVLLHAESEREAIELAEAYERAYTAQYEIHRYEVVGVELQD